MANIWKQFEQLLDKDVTQIATVTSTDGSTSVVELLSGDPLKVRGTGPVGDKVYIRGGEIIQQAGTLQQFDMVLY
jgi:hypothetical protein